MADRRPMRPMGRRRGTPGEKAKDFKGTIKKLLGYMGYYKIAIVVVMIFAAGSTVFTVIGPKILGMQLQNCLADCYQNSPDRGASIFKRLQEFCSVCWQCTLQAVFFRLSKAGS